MESWDEEEKGRVRQLRSTKKKTIRALRIEAASVRRLEIQWYCGTFPLVPVSISASSKPVLQKKLEKTERLMEQTKWTSDEKEEEQTMLNEFKRTLPTKWK